MAIPAMARAPIPATSLLAAPVYLATAGPVLVGPDEALQLEQVPTAEAGVLLETAGAEPAGLVTGLAEQVLG